jgi:tetratricopeptide (TPR) repeat protein
MDSRENSALVSRQLPWFIAIGAFVLYLLTLNRWVSLASLPLVSTLTDPAAAPPVNGPLLYLLTYPVRFVPVGSQPLVLNGLAALCGALTLALLARSVALLPHDRTRDQRHRERADFARLSLRTAWVPPLFAAVVCGLQLAYWEHATAGTGQMLDLLLFAYLIRCLLEFRIDERESWLTRLAFVYGVGAANHQGLIAFFPGFLAALVWIRGRDFFNAGFILRMAAWGLAGLSLYLVLPLAAALSAQSDFTFWQALRVQLAAQKQALLGMPKYIVLFGCLTSVLPVLFMGIRWPSSFGDVSAAGVLITNLMFRVVHALFLVACLWVIFDLPGSPRLLYSDLLAKSGSDAVGVVPPFLGMHYLCSLSLGYLLGYFLLVFGRTEERTWRRATGLARLGQSAVVALTWIVAVAVPLALVIHNLPAVKASDGSHLKHYAQLAHAGLASGGGVVLSDDSFLQMLLATYVNQSGAGDRHLLIGTTWLRYPTYQASLHRRAPALWPAPPPIDSPAKLFLDGYLAYQVSGAATTNLVHYLHPSFGYFFEDLYPRTDGLVHRLAPYGTNELAPPRLSPEQIQRNQQFWTNAWPRLEVLRRQVAAQLTEARAVGRWYSRALNYWGVLLQRDGRAADAGQYFTRAVELNSGNLLARINLEFNQSLQQGKIQRVQPIQAVEERLGPRFRSWDSFLGANGPADEPGICLRLGQLMMQQSLLRQATLEFLRVVQLEPENLVARLWLANSLLSLNLPAKALAELDEVRSRKPSADQQIEAIRMEALARFALGDRDAVEALFARARSQFPKAESLCDAESEYYVSIGRLTNALQVTEQQLQLNPGSTRVLLRKAMLLLKLEAYGEAEAALRAVLQRERDDVQALLTQSALYIQTKRYAEAQTVASRVLELSPNNQAALMNRAIARLQSGELDGAASDYQVLYSQLPTFSRVHYGLGEIAFRRKQNAEAIKYYELYLKHAAPDTEEAKQIASRLQQLKTATR